MAVAEARRGRVLDREPPHDPAGAAPSAQGPSPAGDEHPRARAASARATNPSPQRLLRPESPTSEHRCTARWHAGFRVSATAGSVGPRADVRERTVIAAPYVPGCSGAAFRSGVLITRRRVLDTVTRSGQPPSGLSRHSPRPQSADALRGREARLHERIARCWLVIPSP